MERRPLRNSFPIPDAPGLAEARHTMKPLTPPAGVTVCRCYLRVSSDEQDPAVQRARMQAFCDERG